MIEAKFHKSEVKFLDNGIEFIFNDVRQLRTPEVFSKDKYEMDELGGFYLIKKISKETQLFRIEKKVNKILEILENGRF